MEKRLALRASSDEQSETTACVGNIITYIKIIFLNYINTEKYHKRIVFCREFDGWWAVSALMVKWYNSRLPRGSPGFDSRSTQLGFIF
uniref:Calpain catalytic domain-containing protein n=1 Tax=Strongyloides venezuelensis TaxID=75913 RepID=A0A0K0G5Z3_STRVS